MPMAGEGRRFREAGYTVAKPFIDVAGAPMIERVMCNLPAFYRELWLVRSQDAEAVAAEIKRCEPPPTLCYLQELTKGPADTVLRSRGIFANNREPMLVADCDQWADWSHLHFTAWLGREHPDAALVTFRATGSQYSYAKYGPQGLVSATAEKRQISDDACAGIWWWRTAELAYQSIEQMMRETKPVNGEWYIAPSFNNLIAQGLKVLAYPVARLYSMGTPEALRDTLASGIFGGSRAD
jgi:NDP-sugar pyrophosphorylase family protein